MTTSETGYPIPPLPDYALPPFVQTPEDRERWELVHALAIELSRQNEPTGEPNSQFVWFYSRTLYHSILQPVPPTIQRFRSTSWFASANSRVDETQSGTRGSAIRCRHDGT